MIVLLMLTSCSYDTKVVCDCRWHHKMTMKILMQRCHYLRYGDAWVKKQGEEYGK